MIITTFILIVVSATVSFASTGDAEHNNDYGHATEIAIGETVTEKLDRTDYIDGNKYDYYTITAPISGKIKISCDLRSTDFLFLQAEDENRKGLWYVQSHNYKNHRGPLM